MKTIIKSINFNKEVETKYGIMFQYYVSYDDKHASFICKTKDKYPFKIDEENEFIETEREYNGKTYYNIKAIQSNTGQSNYGRALKREQSKYSGFGVSYVKDLIIAGKIDIKDWEKASEKIIKFMIEIDKDIEQ